MKTPAILSPTCFVLGFIFLFFSNCSKEEDPIIPPITNTKYDIPINILNTIFTSEQLKAEELLDEIKKNGMFIHEGTNPPVISNLNRSESGELNFTIEHTCIYDDQASSNVGSVYGKYEQTIRVLRNQDGSFAANVSYSSVADPQYPEYRAGLDQGSGTGFATGNGNNFTVFFKVGNARFDNIEYDAIWIISGTVSNFPEVQEVTNITKCLVMLRKGDDPDDKVANPKTKRIFRDASSVWNQPAVVITNFSPTEGPYFTEVTINGSGFSLNKEENIVKINGVPAEVLEAGLTRLRVAVPKGAGTGPVTVEVKDNSGTGGIFTYIPVYTVSTLAGNGRPGNSDGSGFAAQFNTPYGIAVNVQNNILVSDTTNNRLREITPAGTVSTRRTAGDPRNPKTELFFNYMNGIAVNAQGTAYVVESGYRILMLTTQGIVSTLQQTSANDSSTAFFISPYGVAVDIQNNVYVADWGFRFQVGPSIEKVTAAGIRSVLAGGSQIGFLDGTGQAARFNNPQGIAVDAQGNVYVADTQNHSIRKVTPTGVVSTLAGNGQAGFQDGTGSAARFNNPKGVAVDADGNIYVADSQNHRIRKVTSAGLVSTLAGTGQANFIDGKGSIAQFNNPTGVAIDAQGIIYVADLQNHSIRKMVLE